MSADNFVSDLIEAMPTPQAKLCLIACLAKYSGLSVYLPVVNKKERRVRAATSMLGNHMSESDAAAAIVGRYNVSLRTAQRDVSDARKMSLKIVVSC